MKTLGERVKEQRAICGYSQAKLAKLAGVTQQSINALETRKSEKSMHILEIAKALNVSPDYLLTGEEYKSATASRTYKNKSISGPLELSYIPILNYDEVLEFKSILSKMNDKIDNHSSSSSSSSREYVVVTQDQLFSDYVFAVKIIDDSMMPVFKQGDEIVIDPGQNASINPGCYVIAMHPKRKTPYVRVYRETSGGCELVPLNQNHATDETDDAEGVIIGRAVRHISKI